MPSVSVTGAACPLPAVVPAASPMLTCCTPDPNAARERRDSDVYLNVYDITSLNHMTALVGVGAHHSGVEIYSNEYCFGRGLEGTGVYSMAPKTCADFSFRETIYVGSTHMSRREVNSLVRHMKDKCVASSYHLVRYNCNDFAEELCKMLLGDRQVVPFPSWVNRACRSMLWMLPSGMVEKIDQVDYQMFLKREGYPADTQKTS